ncbi:MAG: AMP-binding protein, partial [Bacteroidales bacterium]
MKKNKFLPAIEQKSLPEIIKFQEKQLRAELQYLLQYSKYYKQLFSKNKINTAKIKTLADLKNIPVTTKDELQKHNKNFICVHSKDIIDYMTTSGTLGEPVTYTATHHDLERLAYNEAMSFACAGVKPDDVVQIMTTLDRRFMAGLAYFLGLRKMGAGIVRAGSGVPELHWDSIFRYKPKYMIVVPSFILKLIEFAEANNID